MEAVVMIASHLIRSLVSSPGADPELCASGETAALALKSIVDTLEP
eukprot:CAMPEP_0185854974 /NCGR_PEP_ID=MMETSP1354-20130828/24176_1 /TAXON_ID=708628 /ORGANISM="Erythrolobus madagascarensis, Strain CCMP3276" /LENGTH=45 /DNA_ID= /DNA_START= /DNA_END= /DNA_ORIENTATION=